MEQTLEQNLCNICLRSFLRSLCVDVDMNVAILKSHGFVSRFFFNNQAEDCLIIDND